MDDINRPTLRVRIDSVPALRYEGFDLSPYEAGRVYEVDALLARLLIAHGYARPESDAHEAGVSR
jgi:hypothetical protein